MSFSLEPLWARAFLSGDARAANALITRARELFGREDAASAGAQGEIFSYEVVLPRGLCEGQPDALTWMRETLLPRLVYHCESSRAALPACSGVFVSAFVGETLHCVAAREVIAFACEQLGLAWEELVARHGTGEVRHALRDDEPLAADDPREPARLLGDGA